MANTRVPDALDAVVAARQHHKLLLENEKIRVLETVILPGDETAIHTHIWPGYLYILSWSDCIRYDADRNVVMDSKSQGFAPDVGSAIWAKPLPAHSLRNVGSGTIHIILTEFKDEVAE